MKNLLFIFILTASLCGCESDIDRCVKAQVVAWKERNKSNEAIIAEKEKSKNLKLSDVWELIPEELESEVIAKAHLACLKASGKN
jgi:hypothetical protein